MIWRGRRFRRTFLALPRRGVVAHYRECRPRFALHVFRLTDGRFVADHLDRWNPEYGPVHAVWHLLEDVLCLPGGGAWVTRSSRSCGSRPIRERFP
jgi:hypothetical protein